MRDLLLRRQATSILLRGYDYWETKRGSRSMPARADIDPIEMKAFLPHVVLMDVLRDAKPGYLLHIPRVWRWLAQDLAHPALAPVKAWFDRHIPPERRRVPEALRA